MATKWPEKRRIVGTEVKRLDGPEKATGKAKYSYDINRPGLLQAMILRCPHARAKIKSIDTKAAEQSPGFKALHLIAKVGDEMFFAGDEVLAIAADTEEHCQDAIRAVKIEYEELPFLVKEEDALKDDKGTVPPVQNDRKNIRTAGGETKGNFDEAYKGADARVEGTYGSPTICHQCLESHGLVAEWNGDQTQLTVWCSTQATTGTAEQLRRHFKLNPGDARCVTHYMGGGFGSKFGPDVQGVAAAELAKKAKAPVKLMLDRESEIIAAGNRPSAYGTVKMAGNKDGTLVAYSLDCHGTPGVGTAASVRSVPYVYTIPNVKIAQKIVRLNTGSLRAFRAPRHPQACYLTDCAVDDLCAKLGLDPMEVRRKNVPKDDDKATNPVSFNAVIGSIYQKEIDIAAKLSDWKNKWHQPGTKKVAGPIMHGIGMALHTWGGQASPRPNECTVIIAQDGSVTAQTSTQDLGTAQRTVTAIVVAELLGLKPTDIITRIGESQYGDSSGSGGSTTCPSQAPATLQAAAAVLEDLFTKIAQKLGSKKEDLSAEGGKVVDKGRGKEWSWKEACAKLGMDQAKATGMWNARESFKEENRGISSSGVGGVQVAEVHVDTETGVVRCIKIVAVQDCGLIVNKLACESQVAGGVIMGLNYALFEERIMDRATGRQVNADMEFYKLGGIQDMPDIVVHMHDMPERGVIGIGEPPTISTHAAIGNAVANAIGVRVPETPFSPDRVLAALAKKGGN